MLLYTKGVILNQPNICIELGPIGKSYIMCQQILLLSLGLQKIEGTILSHSEKMP